MVPITFFSLLSLYLFCSLAHQSHTSKPTKKRFLQRRNLLAPPFHTNIASALQEFFEIIGSTQLWGKKATFLVVFDFILKKHLMINMQSILIKHLRNDEYNFGDIYEIIGMFLSSSSICLYVPQGKNNSDNAYMWSYCVLMMGTKTSNQSWIHFSDNCISFLLCDPQKYSLFCLVTNNIKMISRFSFLVSPSLLFWRFLSSIHHTYKNVFLNSSRCQKCPLILDQKTWFCHPSCVALPSFYWTLKTTQKLFRLNKPLCQLIGY